MHTQQAPRMYAEPTNPVRVVLLADGRGRGQVVVPVSHLLDLKLLNSLVERELVPMRQRDIVDLTRAGKLTQVESAPVFFLLPTILDEAVAGHTHCQYDIITVDGVERQEVALSTLREALLHTFGYLVLALIFPPHFSSLGRDFVVNPHISHASPRHRRCASRGDSPAAVSALRARPGQGGRRHRQGVGRGRGHPQDGRPLPMTRQP